MEIKYNTPIVVTKEQYNRLLNDFAGIVAGREENGIFYIKVFIMKYNEYIKQILA